MIGEWQEKEGGRWSVQISGMDIGARVLLNWCDVSVPSHSHYHTHTQTACSSNIHTQRVHVCQKNGMTNSFVYPCICDSKQRTHILEQ